MIIFAAMLGAERWDVVAVHLLGFADGGELGSLEDLEADVAAAFGHVIPACGGTARQQKGRRVHVHTDLSPGRCRWRTPATPRGTRRAPGRFTGGGSGWSTCCRCGRATWSSTWAAAPGCVFRCCSSGSGRPAPSS